MEAKASKSPHPLVWVAAISLIVFSAAGVGAMMGWIPTSIGKQEEAVLTVKQDKQAPVRVAKAPVPAAVVVAAKCVDCGVIQSVREIEAKGVGTGLGAVGGAVVGGALGSQVGGGDGKKVMAVVGAVGGAVAGNEIEKRVKSTKSYEITVHLEDGTNRVFTEASAPSWRTGDKVRIVNGVIQSNA